MEILFPPRQLLLPRFEFPTWLKFPRGFMASGRMKKGAGGGASNVLASVPWVAQWKFNSNGNDSVGANNLTNNNSATFTTGKLGGATGATHLVQASSQSWSIASNSNLQVSTTTDFTWLSWLKLTTTDAYRAINKNTEFLIYYGASRFKFDVKNGTGVVTANSFGAPSTGVWYCVIAWYDSVAQTINIQINDGTVDSAAYVGGITAGSAALGIGCLPGFTGQEWNGDIDNVCFAKSAAGAGGVLSAAQRTAFYAAGVGTETLS